MKILLFIICFVCSVVSNAQSKQELAIEFLKEVFNTYANANSYNMQIEVYTNASEQALQLPMQQNRAIKNGTEFYTETPNIINVISKKHQLFLDKEKKVMQLKKLSDEEINIINKTKETRFIPELDDIKLTILDFAITDNDAVVTFGKDVNFEKTVYYFNKTAKTLSKIEYVPIKDIYGRPALITIHYKNTTINKPVSPDFFNINTYIKNIDGKAKAAKEYSDYTVVNLNDTEQ